MRKLTKFGIFYVIILILNIIVTFTGSLSNLLTVIFMLLTLIIMYFHGRNKWLNIFKK
jgi:hypothetical protein